jgi:hypothetical protein
MCPPYKGGIGGFRNSQFLCHSGKFRSGAEKFIRNPGVSRVTVGVKTDAAGKKLYGLTLDSGYFYFRFRARL